MRLAKSYGDARLQAAARRTLAIGSDSYRSMRVNPQPPPRRSPTRADRIRRSDRAPQHPRLRLLLLRGHRHVDSVPEWTSSTNSVAPAWPSRCPSNSPRPRSRTCRSMERAPRRPRAHRATLPTAHQPAQARPAQTRCLHRGHRLPRAPWARQGPRPVIWPTGAGSVNTSASSSSGRPASEELVDCLCTGT